MDDGVVRGRVEDGRCGERETNSTSGEDSAPQGGGKWSMMAAKECLKTKEETGWRRTV